MKHFYPFSLWLILILIAHNNLQAQQVTFSKERGFYSATFNLTLTSDLSGATIKYTTNGTAPSSSVGTTYSGTININTTTVVRAIAIKGATISKVFTHSYIFPNKVILQPANIPDWPNNVYDLGSSGSAIHDYEMDPDIVNNSTYSGQMISALTSIPSMSIVMDQDQFWQVYDDPDGDLENPASVELLYADAPTQNEQVNCGLESHSHLRMKRSMKLDFHDPEFISKIFKYAPLNGSGATDDFSGAKIVLRGGNNDCWSRNWNPSGSTYTKDEWYRASQLAVDGYGSHGTFVHLYINGLYWGLYNPVERPDEGFASEYLGGSTGDWLSLNHDGIREGDPTRYNYLINTLVNKDISVTSNYNELKEYLDASAFADYLIVSSMPGMSDWPNGNYYGGNRNTPPGPFMYFGWDGEWSWTNLHSGNNGAWVSPFFRTTATSSLPIPKIWRAARANSDFMMLFADRVYKNCFNGGPMTDDASRARWAAINNFISQAIIAESARWGDVLNPSTPRTKNGDWQPEVNRIDALMNGNVTRFINALQAEGFYPTINPPNFNSEGGNVASGFQLAMTNPNGAGTIYYTTNGSDPRTSGGGLLAGALTYSSPVAINGTMTIKARVKNGNIWSALHEGTYAAGTFPDITKLFINEFLASNQTDIVDEFGQHDDWFEIYNDNTTPVNIGGLYVTDNLSLPTKYQIPTTNPTATTIPAKGFLLLWADEETAQGPLHVGFKLGNGGEDLGLVQLAGTITRFIDSYSFGPQTANISTGRLPNGGSNFVTFTTTTPGASNQGPGPIDCNGVTNGTAALDDCGICSGGNTGHVANSDKDNCGVCFGNGSSCGSACVHNQVVSLTLMHQGSGGVIGPLTNGMIINKATIGTFSIRGDLCDGPVGSVRFVLNGSTVRTDNSSPYSLNGDSQGSYTAWNPNTGSYSLIATPYTNRNGTGNAGISLTVNFTVVNQANAADCNGVAGGTATIDDCGICAGGNTGKTPNANKDCNGVCNGTASLDGCGICSGGNTGHVANSDKDNCGVCFGNGSSCTPSSCVHNQVVSFTLMKEGTAGTIGPLTNGMTINKATIGSFSIRADVCDSPVGSVKFALNGSTVKTETEFPYALNGDDAGSYIAWNPNTGSYTLKATPYSGAGGSGSAGVNLTITFTVVNQANAPDCNGVAGGAAAIDDCGVCSGGNTGHVANSDKDACGVCFGNGSSCAGTYDCNGVLNGTAALDDCNVCAGGNTGKIPNANKDACGVCFGNGSSCNTSCVHNQVVSFTLMHVGTNGEIGPLTTGMTINKAAIGKFSIRANVCDSPVGSVKFVLNGSSVKTETAFPYALNGDEPTGNYNEWNPNPGSFTLKATPYSGAGATGSSGISLTITFTVVNQSSSAVDCNGVTGGSAHLNSCGICVGGNTGKPESQGKDCNGVCSGTAVIDDCGVCAGGNTGKVANANKDACGVCFGNGSSCASCVHNEVVSFTLMKADTDGEIGPLTNGMIISKASIGQFSIRANVCDSPVGSVKFTLNGSTFNTETTPPYALNGDNPVGSYTPWNASARSYTLMATPYSKANATGTAGISKTVTFTVVNSGAKMDEEKIISSNEILEFGIYPNPNNGQFIIKGYRAEKADMEIRVFTSLGQEILMVKEKELSGNYTKQFDTKLIPGIYYIEMTWGDHVQREKVIAQ